MDQTETLSGRTVAEGFPPGEQRVIVLTETRHLGWLLLCSVIAILVACAAAAWSRAAWMRADDTHELLKSFIHHTETERLREADRDRGVLRQGDRVLEDRERPDGGDPR